ncbi:unnamed protein product [Orchesella dallaii]|uniref:Kazal-like domain-containing protein n=1 Tax=Orchesella dallaii TaxID=48710 RepID=A0ABP1RAX8_9HEXA
MKFAVIFCTIFFAASLPEYQTRKTTQFHRSRFGPGRGSSRRGCHCPRIYLPECGANGRTYWNSCLRQCHDVPFAYDGSCYPEPMSLPPPLPPPTPPPPMIIGDQSTCYCAQIYLPECGVDGKTYSNSCLRKCDDVALAHQGACGALPLPKPGTDCGICPKIYIPECGGDGVTYANSCLRECKENDLAANVTNSSRVEECIFSQNNDFFDLSKLNQELLYMTYD